MIIKTIIMIRLTGKIEEKERHNYTIVIDEQEIWNALLDNRGNEGKIINILRKIRPFTLQCELHRVDKEFDNEYQTTRIYPCSEFDNMNNGGNKYTILKTEVYTEEEINSFTIKSLFNEI